MLCRQITKFAISVGKWFYFLYSWDIRRKIWCCGVMESSLIYYIYPWNLLMYTDILQSWGSRPFLSVRCRSYTLRREISRNVPEIIDIHWDNKVSKLWLYVFEPSPAIVGRVKLDDLHRVILHRRSFVSETKSAKNYHRFVTILTKKLKTLQRHYLRFEFSLSLSLSFFLPQFIGGHHYIDMLLAIFF